MPRYSTVGSRGHQAELPTEVEAVRELSRVAFGAAETPFAEAPGRPPGRDQRPRTMRLGIGLIAAVLAVAGEAFAQQTPATPPPADPSRRLTFETAFPPLPPVTADPGTAPRQRGWAPQVELTLSCPACEDDLRPPMIGAQPQWTMHGRAGVGNDRQRLTVGLAVQRNARLPLFLTETLGGEALPEPRSSFSAMGDSADRWQATLQYERLLWRSRSGTTVGVGGDVFVPIVPWGGAKDSPERRRNLAGRAGLRVRF
jgi:hypothetical protein